MKHFPSVLFCIIVLFSSGKLFASQDEQMHMAVERLVHAAQERTVRCPWERPLPEVAKAAAYGKAITPLLLERLVDIPDSLENDMPEADWNV